MNEALLRIYVQEGLSQREIARRLGRSQTTVRRWLIKYDIIQPPKQKKICLNCSNPCKKFYCSNQCQRDAQWSAIKETIKKDKIAPNHRLAKKFLLEERGNICENCGLPTWFENPILLVLDHIDGDATNNAIDNLRLVCSNCDAILPTYKNKNKGNGRFSRRQRYKEGKSY